ncbi:MAG: glycosyltransferase family 39 protein [Candidatus Omnitrophica bacterium]|nr:glycosyltransferase family 39 protein [Candidatus Omnitrophota bacterium]
MKTQAIKKKMTTILLVLILIIATHALINYIWLQKDNYPLWFDHGQYFQRSVELYYATQGDAESFQRAVLGLGASYQPYLHRALLPLVSMPFYYIFGLSGDIAVMTCLIFLSLAVFATYAIASRLFDRITGLLAAFILSVSPGFFIFSRRYSPEFAVIGITTITIYFLLSSDYFKNRLYSILFGLGFGLCMITKESAFAFIPAVFIYVLYKAGSLHRSREESSQRKRFFINLLFSAAAAGAVIIPLYWMYREVVFSRVSGVAFSTEVKQIYNMQEPYNPAGLTYYANQFFQYYFGRLFSLLFIVGAFFCLKQRCNQRGIIFWWLIGSYIILSSTVTRVFEYSLPLLVPLSIIAAYGINQLFKTKIKRALLFIFIIFWGSGQLLLTSFPIKKNLPEWFSYKSIILAENFRDYHPDAGDWRLDEIVDYIASNKQQPDRVRYVHVGANLLAFSPVVLEYVCVEKREKFDFYGYNAPLESILACDFVVVKSGQDQGLFYSSQEAGEVAAQLISSGDFYMLPRQFSLPDGSKAVIYKKMGASD